MGMLANIIRNIFSRPATRPYPFAKREPFENTRGKIVFSDTLCVFCGACAKKCPTSAIRVDRTKKELVFEPFRCIACGYCSETCPKKAIVILAEYRTPEVKKVEEIYSKPPENIVEESKS